jgi:hypothetical protein
MCQADDNAKFESSHAHGQRKESVDAGTTIEEGCPSKGGAISRDAGGGAFLG